MRTVVGLFDRFEDAQQAVRALLDANFTKEDINLIASDANGDFKRYIDANPQGEGQNVADGAATGAGVGAVLGGLGGLLLGLGVLAIPGIGPVLAAGPIASALIGAGAGAVTGGVVGALVDLGIPEEHAKAYAEGIRRGGTLVTVRTPDNQSDQAVQILERFHPVDINRQMQSWQSSGGQDIRENAQTMGMTDTTTDRDENFQPMNVSEEETDRASNIPVTGADQTMDIPVVEEEMNIGKRQVETGGVRVEKNVREEPVEEDVELRHEHVNVERRPVNRDATDEDMNTFKEGSMEFTETDEEVVAEKRPKVVEEVHIDKDVDTETQTVRDTLHKEEVNVQRTGKGDFQRFDQNFRNHFQTTFGSQGMDYNDYMPAYQYGYNLATDSRFNNYDWNGIEPEARVAWERRYGQGTWDRVRDAVHYAWDTTRG